MKINFSQLSLIFLLAIFFIACGQDGKITVTVSNPLEIAREKETVEVRWKDITAKISDITVDKIIVSDASGKQIPSQVVYLGFEDPQVLIFQVSVEASKSAEYIIEKGIRANYPNEASGRFVPERQNDYAWENNLGVFRIYGAPFWEEKKSAGIDYWAKSTSKLIKDEWYEKELKKIASYHIDFGEGCDCYDVGTTLGMGASAPYVNGQVWNDHYFSQWKTLDNGTIRTTVELTYDSINVDGKNIKQKKVISLDANSYFNEITDTYSGEFENIPVVAGVVIHKGAETFFGTNYCGLYEPQSFTRGDGPLSSIGGAMIMTGGAPQIISETIACVVNAKVGIPFVYYAGAATSKQNIDLAKWKFIVAEKAKRVEQPLLVTLK